jgi:hypothetical protein
MAVNAFKMNKAPGPDEFRAECLQAMDDLTVNYIIKLYGASIALEYVPTKWREVTVIFNPKPGESDYTDKRAFHPISLMSVLFKRLEISSSGTLKRLTLLTDQCTSHNTAFAKENLQTKR